MSGGHANGSDAEGCHSTPRGQQAAIVPARHGVHTLNRADGLGRGGTSIAIARTYRPIVEQGRADEDLSEDATE